MHSGFHMYFFIFMTCSTFIYWLKHVYCILYLGRLKFGGEKGLNLIKICRQTVVKKADRGSGVEKGQKLRKFCRRPKWIVPYTKTSVGVNGTLKIAHNLVVGRT